MKQKKAYNLLRVFLNHCYTEEEKHCKDYKLYHLSHGGLRGCFNSLVVTYLINLLYMCASVLIRANIIPQQTMQKG